MGVSDWPEDNYMPFKVFPVKPKESDQDAIIRAMEEYGDDVEFYIDSIENE